MNYDPNQSSLHLVGAAPAMTGQQRQPFTFKDAEGAKMPTCVLPHRGVTIRTLQAALAEHARATGRTSGLYNLELDGVHIGRLSVQV